MAIQGCHKNERKWRIRDKVVLRIGTNGVKTTLDSLRVIKNGCIMVWAARLFLNKEVSDKNLSNQHFMLLENNKLIYSAFKALTTYFKLNKKRMLITPRTLNDTFLNNFVI